METYKCGHIKIFMYEETNNILIFYVAVTFG